MDDTILYVILMVTIIIVVTIVLISLGVPTMVLPLMYSVIAIINTTVLN